MHGFSRALARGRLVASESLFDAFFDRLRVQFRQSLSCRRLDPRRLRRPLQELFVSLARVAPHDRSHHRVGLHRLSAHADRIPVDQPVLRQPFQHPLEDFRVRLHVIRRRVRGHAAVDRNIVLQPHTDESPQT